MEVNPYGGPVSVGAPGAPGATGGAGGFGAGISALFADPNFQALLAGIAQRADPEGVGGVLGGAATALIQSKAAQKALESQDVKRDANLDPLRPTPSVIQRAAELMRGNPDVTPLTKAGINSVKAGPNGNAIIDINLQDVPGKGTSTGTASPVTSAAPAPTVAPTDNDIRSLLPFLVSPGGYTRGSLAGLTPDQVAQFGQLDTQREQLRQQSVERILRGFQLNSEIQSAAVNRELTKEQMEKIRRLAPYDVENAVNELALQRAKTKALNQGIVFNETEERRKIEEEKRKATMAPILESRARSEAERARIEAKSVTLQGEGMPPFEITSETAARLIPEAARAQAEARRQERLEAQHQDSVKRQQDAVIRTERKESLDRRKDAATAESTILNPQNRGKEAALEPQMDIYNANSTGTGVWIHFPEENPNFFKSFVQGQPNKINKEYAQQNKKVTIPKIKGIQYTAEEITKAAAELGLTIRQFLEQEIYPRAGEVPPWLRP